MGRLPTDGMASIRSREKRRDFGMHRCRTRYARLRIRKTFGGILYAYYDARGDAESAARYNNLVTQCSTSHSPWVHLNRESLTYKSNPTQPINLNSDKPQPANR